METGKLLAKVLAGSWRPTPSPLSLSPTQWDVVAPRLLETGAAGLGWWRLRDSSARPSRVAMQLRQAYRLHTLQAGIYEEHIRLLFTHCRAAGVEPLLGKGWTASRLYLDPGLRPYGDIDLFLRPEQYSAALAVLHSPAVEQCHVDLHRGFPDLAAATLHDVYGRSQLVSLGGVEVRILGPEDHLRHLCLHFLRHGAWRPLWLCDIGAALESQAPGFDWDYCLRGGRRQKDAVACAIGLAQRLLDARVDAPLLTSLPRWLLPAVLRQWGSRYTRYTDRRMADYLRYPAGVVQALRRRWPNPIEATFSTRGPFNDLPRLPFQLGDVVERLAKFIVALPQELFTRAGWRRNR
jgi:hypothetical protein